MKLKMKTRNLLITLIVTALASINVMATGALLSPRASEQQSKIVAAVNADPNLAAPGLASASPRLLDNQPKTAAGKSTGESPSAVCVRRMGGTPKMIGACADHPGAPMSCCSVADTK
jgi:hypothetical protein